MAIGYVSVDDTGVRTGTGDALVTYDARISTMTTYIATIPLDAEVQLKRGIAWAAMEAAFATANPPAPFVPPAPPPLPDPPPQKTTGPKPPAEGQPPSWLEDETRVGRQKISTSDLFSLAWITTTNVFLHSDGSRSQQLKRSLELSLAAIKQDPRPAAVSTGAPIALINRDPKTDIYTVLVLLDGPVQSGSAILLKEPTLQDEAAGRLSRDPPIAMAVGKKKAYETALEVTSHVRLITIPDIIKSAFRRQGFISQTGDFQ